MKSVGFKNFRRFKNLDPIDLAPISIFVGENNSGKSTVVKGILTFLGFMEEDCDCVYLSEKDRNEERRLLSSDDSRLSHNQRFRFNKNYYAHIGTSWRALRKGADTKEIGFFLDMDRYGYDVVVKIDEDNADSTSGRIIELDLHLRWRTQLRFDLESWKAELIFHTDNPKKYKERAEDFAPDSRQYKGYMGLYEYFSSFSEDRVFKMDLPEIDGVFGHKLAEVLISAVEMTINSSIWNALGKTPSEEYMMPYVFRYSGVKTIDLTEEDISIFAKSPLFSRHSRPDELDELRILSYGVLGTESFEYLYAHAVTQSIIYSAKDTNDYLVKTINDFANTRISKHVKGKNRKIDGFIEKWMKAFGIGTGFSVQSFGGEAHIVKIRKDDMEVNLADLGMGSIQLMILLFRIAIILDARSDFGRSDCTVILEEPEQNLHPMLQSKLAEFLLEVYKEYKIRFIVETHSEYLVRKTQVIVGDMFNTPEKLKENPFRVIYFPSGNQNPYDMKYTTSGAFAKPFGPGFFDEAAKLHMTVVKNTRKQ